MSMPPETSMLAARASVPPLRRNPLSSCTEGSYVIRARTSCVCGRREREVNHSRGGGGSSTPPIAPIAPIPPSSGADCTGCGWGQKLTIFWSTPAAKTRCSSCDAVRASTSAWCEAKRRTRVPCLPS